jgi:hypothetical protein
MKKNTVKIGSFCFFLLFISLYSSNFPVLYQYLSTVDKKDIFPTIDKYNITRPDLHHFFYSQDMWAIENVLFNNDIASDITIVFLNTKFDTLYVKRKQPIITIDVYVTNNSDSTITFLHDQENAYGFAGDFFYPVVYNTWKNKGKKTYKRLRKIENDYYLDLRKKLDEGLVKETMQDLESNIYSIDAKETLKMKVKLDLRVLNGSQMFVKLTKNEYYISIFYRCFPVYIENLTKKFDVDLDVRNLYGGRTRSNLMKLIVED